MDEKMINRHICHQLVKAREELGYTQKKVQEDGIVSQSVLSKIENGASQVTASRLQILAKYYRKPIEYFFKDE